MIQPAILGHTNRCYHLTAPRALNNFLEVCSWDVVDYREMPLLTVNLYRLHSTNTALLVSQ